MLPARFELKAKPGEVVREVLEIGNDGALLAEYSLKTADWTMGADGAVTFSEDLAPGSCRPWSRLERHTVKVEARSRRRFRFEVHVPKDAPAGLCRFALLVELTSDAANVAPSPNIQVPIQGRIGVIVYVRVGDASPQIEFRGVKVETVKGEPTPFVVLANTGNAHARPLGVLTGNDATGKPVDYTVASLPILPGTTRAIPIWPMEVEGRKPAPPSYPVRLSGRIEWEGGRREVEFTLSK